MSTEENKSEKVVPEKIESRGLGRSAWQVEIKKQIQHAREDMGFTVNKAGMDRVLDILDEIVRRI